MQQWMSLIELKTPLVINRYHTNYLSAAVRMVYYFSGSLTIPVDLLVDFVENMHKKNS